MPIANITNVNPYAVDRRANIAASRQFGASIQQGVVDLFEGFREAERREIEAEERKYQKQQRHQAQVDREKKLYTETNGALVQAKAKDSYMGEQAAQIGFQEQQEFLELQDELKDVDISSERQAEITERLEEIKAQSGIFAQAITNLNTNAASWAEFLKNDTISDATDPAVRSFMMDLIDQDNEDGFTLVQDDEGRWKYKGTTSGGHEVDFFVDDIASGKNQFSPTAELDTTEWAKGVVEQLELQNRTIEDKYGIFQETDADKAGKDAATIIKDSLGNDQFFRQYASAKGFDFEDIQTLQNDGVVPFLNPGDAETFEEKDDIPGISSEEELKGYLANLATIEVGSQIPNNKKYLSTAKYQQGVKNTVPRGVGASTQQEQVEQAKYSQRLLEEINFITPGVGEENVVLSGLVGGKVKKAKYVAPNKDNKQFPDGYYQVEVTGGGVNKIDVNDRGLLFRYIAEANGVNPELAKVYADQFNQPAQEDTTTQEDGTASLSSEVEDEMTKTLRESNLIK